MEAFFYVTKAKTTLEEQVRARGVIPFPVDVSEFMDKGGGALKCMLLDLGEL